MATPQDKLTFDQVRQQRAKEKEEQDDKLTFEQVREQRQGVDTSPIPLPETRTIGGAGHPQSPFNIGEMELPGGERLSESVKAAANAGVIWNQPAPAGHMIAGFAFDKENEALAYQIGALNQTGGILETRVGPATGEPEYFDLESRRWALANPPGPSRNDAQRMVGPALQIGMEVALTAPAVVLTSPTVGGMGIVAGVSVPAAVFTEAGRIWMGRQMGINQNVDRQELYAHLSEVGLLAGAVGFAGDVGLTTSKFVADWIMGRMTSRKLARDLGLDFDEAARISERLNEKLIENRFRLSIGQASQNEDLMIFENFLRKDKNFAKSFREFDEQQQAAFQEFFDLINQPHHALTQRHGGNRQVGLDVQEFFINRTGRRQAELNLAIRRDMAERDLLLSGMDSRKYESIGRPFRGIITEETENFSKWAKRTTSELDDIFGNEPIIQNNRLAEVVGDFDKKRKEALFPFQAKELKSVIGERKVLVDDVEGGLALNQDGLLEFETLEAEKIVGKIFDPEARFTVSELWDAISSLKRLRRKARGDVSEPANVEFLTEVIEAAEEDLLRGMPDEGRALYNEFIREYAIGVNQLKRGVVGDLMQRRSDGDFAISDERVFDQIFTERRNAKQVFEILQDNPTGLNDMRQAIADNFKRTVVDPESGEIQIGAFNRWMEQYGDQIDIFFTRDEIKNFRKTGGIQRAVNAKRDNLEDAIRKINEEFEFEVINLKKPTRMFTDLLAEDNPEYARDFMKALEVHNAPPSLIRNIRAGVRWKLMDNLVNHPTGEKTLSITKINNLVNSDKMKNIRIIFGDQYADDLVTLSEAINLANKRARTFGTSGTAPEGKAIMDLTRAYVGLFTRAGRVVTAANRIRGRAANRAMQDAIMNPGDLRQLIELGEKPPSKKWRQMMLTFGAFELLNEVEEPPAAVTTDENE